MIINNNVFGATIRNIFVCLFCAGASSTFGQSRTVTFSIEIGDTGNGDGLIEPGERAIFTAWAELDPGIGATVMHCTSTSCFPAQVQAIGGAQFDVVPLQAGNTGTFIEWQLTPSLNALNMHGQSMDHGIINIGAAQISLVNPDQRNPIPLWTATWEPSNYLARTVAFGTRPHGSQTPVVWLSVNGLSGPPEIWTQLDVPIIFQVVPSPAVNSLLVVAGVLFSRRRVRA